MMTLEKEQRRQRAEVLAPVGNWDMLRAAIHNGADAVYIGMPGYNARARSEDFDFETLGNMIREAKLHGVRVLVAFNILIFQDELEELSPNLESLLNIQPDAIIVQDVGLARLIRRFAPGQVLHASTQMTVTHPYAIELMEDLGLKRFVLGRELSVDEIAMVRAGTDKELEVFVHGALCVAYSGQCLTSESFGGRSANRGQCAQSCRMPYDLVVDGEVKDLEGAKHLVSPKDLCGLDEVPRLITAGVQSLKIEGRYKSPEYVASTTSAYRKAVDGVKVDSEHRDALEVSFSRGAFKGWLDGVNHEALVSGFHASHRGLHCGEVVKIQKKAGLARLGLDLQRTINRGDSLLFVSLKGQSLGGSQVFEVEVKQQGLTWVDLSRDFDLGILKNEKAIQVYLNRSPRLDKVWQSTWKDISKHKRHAIKLKVLAEKEGDHLELQARMGAERMVVMAQEPLQKAQKRALNEQSVKKNIGAWGRSHFEITELELHLAEGLFLSDKVMRQARQQLQLELEARLSQMQNVAHCTQSELQQWLQQSYKSSLSNPKRPSLSVLIREPEQLEALEGSSCHRVILDYKHGVPYGPCMKKARSMGLSVAIATTRVLKPGAERRLMSMVKLKPDAVLVRNLAALHYLHTVEDKWRVPWLGDFSLNATNHLSIDYLLSKGLDRIAPSYDLNLEQLKALLRKVDPSRLELTVHQYMPSFHMEHCVFATFLSSGTTAKDCGTVCLKHQVELRDSKGVDHPLQADQECRNTMFNGTAQSIASELPTLIEMGVQHYRIEALTESPQELKAKIEGYTMVLDGKTSGETLKSTLGLKEKFGITEGQWLNQNQYRDRKKVNS